MIGLLGAGALGRLWAARLPVGQVVYLPRPGQPAPTLAYTLEVPGGQSLRTRVPALSTPGDLSLLLVTTKAGDALPALDHWLPRLAPSVPVVLFQNGLGSQQAIAERHADRPILAASTTEGANRPTPDRVVHAGRGDTWLGALTPAARCRLDAVAAQLAAAGLRLETTDDILERLWWKLVVNAGINPFTALLDCPNGALLQAPLFLEHIDPLCRELAALMAAEGIGQPRPEALRARIEAVARNTATNTSSMRSDVRQGRRTEIDFINGYLVRVGLRHGIATPVNRMLTEKVRQLTSNRQE